MTTPHSITPGNSRQRKEDERRQALLRVLLHVRWALAVRGLERRAHGLESTYKGETVDALWEAEGLIFGLLSERDPSLDEWFERQAEWRKLEAARVHEPPAVGADCGICRSLAAQDRIEPHLLDAKE
jgi:hypothetical protein